jgi:hypothetical protein
MSLVLGKNPSNELKEINLTNSGLLKVDLAGSSGGAIEANVDITANSIGLATEATASAMNVNLNTLAGAVSGTEFQVDVLTSALPTGAATETTLGSIDSYQSTISTDLGDMNIKMTQGYDAQIASGGSGLLQNLMYGRDATGNLDALLTDASGHLEVVVDDFVKGQALMAASFPVVIASDQSAISVSSAGGNTTNITDTLSPGAGGTATSTAIDMDGFTNLSFFGSTTNTSDQIVVQVSHNNSAWVENTEAYINLSATGGEFFVNVPNTGARYYRVQQVDTLTTAFTLTVQSSKK